MDLTIEAIENDLLLAEQNIGRPGYDLHLTRAKVRATLITKIDTAPSRNPISITVTDVDIRVLEGPFGTVYVVPFKASHDDRLKIMRGILPEAFETSGSETIPPNFGWPIDDPEEKDPDDEDDIFADAKRERRK